MFESTKLEFAKLPPLETFTNPFSDSGMIRITFPEFTGLCPKTGYPDFASIILFYVPRDSCIELKSWKLYLNSFRMVGAFHEQIVQFILGQFWRVLDPKWVGVVGDFIPRGNVDTLVVLEGGQRPPHLGNLLTEFEARCRGL